MRSCAKWLPVVLLAAAWAARESRAMGELSSEIEITGQATGGSLSLGQIRSPQLLTIQTVAGETPADIATKLAAAHQQDPRSDPFQWVSVAPGGQSVIVHGTLAGMVFLRTTDTGIQTVGAVSNLKLTASKAGQKVTLSWDPPTQAPSRILVWRGPMVLKGLPGTATSYEDAEFDDDHGGEPFRLTYTVNCKGAGNAKWSDIVEGLCDNPEVMHDDTFRITTSQIYIPDGVKGQPYTAKLYKSGGTNPVSWSLASGALPDGLTLSPNGIDAAITGTPTAAGTSSFVVRVLDANSATATKALAITVTEYPLLE